MDLLASYSSDDDDDPEQISSIETKVAENSEPASLSVDYFNLGDKIDIPHSVDNRYLNSYDLVKESQRLSNVSYGPCKLDTPDSNKVHSKIIHPNYHKLSNKRPHETYPLQSKLSKSECEDKGKVIISSFDSHSSASEEHNNNSMGNKEVPLFYEDPNISVCSNEEQYSFAPRHQKTTFPGHESAITSLKWCVVRYSYLLLSSSMDSSIKVWDMNRNKHVLKAMDKKGVRSATWSLSGKEILYGGYSKQLTSIDVESGKCTVVCDVQDYVTSIVSHPELPNIILVGTNNKVLVLDKNSGDSPVRTFVSKCQYVLDMAFISNEELLCTTEVVSRDSSDRTVMVWDFGSGAILSNQIYSERYTCPSVAVAPDKKHFIAQSNGDYLVMFSTKRPYKMLNKRYAGHKVSGYGIGCSFSPDGKYIASGDAGGAIYIYCSWSNRLIKKLVVHPETPLLHATWHPVLPSTIAVASGSGNMGIWK